MARLIPILLFAMLCGCKHERHGAGRMTVRVTATRGLLLFFPVHLAQSLGYYGEE